jgi:hypothetical protein
VQLKGNAGMNKQPRIRELQALPKAKSHDVCAANERWSAVYAAITDPDLFAVVAFSAIGLLLAFNLILRFPDFGAVIAQYNQF